MIVAPLRDITVSERESAVFECEVSIAGLSATWYQGEREVTPDFGYDVYSEGKYHELVIDKTECSDSGFITVKIGNKESTAMLTVKGTPH